MEYTRKQLTAEIAGLRQLFDDVKLVDAAAHQVLDPETLEPTGPADEVPVLDERGRAWKPLFLEDTTCFTLYWSVRPEGRPCVLCVTYDLPHADAGNTREANAFYRLLTQARDEMCHDYVTGVYNRTHLDSAFRGHVSAAARDGEKVSAALVRVNEYAALCRSESVAAADRCLNTAAGVLSLALDGMGTETTLIRLEDGVFLVVAVGVSARELENCLQEALRNARRNFGITLARRGEFTATVASADWVAWPKAACTTRNFCPDKQTPCCTYCGRTNVPHCAEGGFCICNRIRTAARPTTKPCCRRSYRTPNWVKTRWRRSWA